MSNFKYLGVDINQQANSHKEINRRITVEINAIFNSTIIKVKIAIQKYKTKTL